MNPTHRSRRRRAVIAPETLEDRRLMTNGAGNTFAILNESITRPDLKVTVPFTLNSTLFTVPKGHITIGVDVAANSGSTVTPEIYGIEDMTSHRMIPVAHAVYSKAVPRTNAGQGPLTSAVTATLNVPSHGTWTHQYAVIVGGENQTVGALLLGFYLPGDSDGNGTVNQADITSIKQSLGMNATNSNYNFAADGNRDGQINASDLRLAQQNLGVSTTVTPVVSANLDAASDSGLQDRVTNIKTVHFDGTATPGASVTYSEISNNAPTTSTVADSSGNYNVYIPLGNGSNTFQVTATDAFGQTISGDITPVTYSLNAAPLPGVTSTPAPTTPATSKS